MGENMEKFRHLDGSDAVIDEPFIKITFQHGHPQEVGVNGCRIEDVIDVLIQLIQNDDKYPAVDEPFIKIRFRRGRPGEDESEGALFEDVIDVLVNKLLTFQGRDLACEENATALYHLDCARESLLLQRRRLESGEEPEKKHHDVAIENLDLAREGLLLRRRRREQQGVLGQNEQHDTA